MTINNIKGEIKWKIISILNLVFEYLPQLLSRLHITLFIVLSATVIGLFLGIILALFRLYKIPVLNQIAIVYISFIRGTPILVQMFIVYYGLPDIINENRNKHK